MQIERLAYRRQLVGVERRRPPRATLCRSLADAGKRLLGCVELRSQSAHDATGLYAQGDQNGCVQNGVLVFWVPMIVFFSWIVVFTVLTLRAIDAETRSGTAEAATAGPEPLRTAATPG